MLWWLLSYVDGATRAGYKKAMHVKWLRDYKNAFNKRIYALGDTGNWLRYIRRMCAFSSGQYLGKPLYTKGQQLFCFGCGEHILTVARDLYSGEESGDLATAFEQAEGQGPWLAGEPSCCRKCKTIWWYGYGVLLGNFK